MKKIISTLIVSTFILTPFVSFAEYVVTGGPTDPNSNYTPSMDTLGGSAGSYSQQNWSTTQSGTQSQNSSGYVAPNSGNTPYSSSFGQPNNYVTGNFDVTAGAPRATAVSEAEASAADQAAYKAELQKMYTGYASSTTAGSQGAASAAASGCIGSFVGNWVGGQLSKFAGSMISSATSLSVPVNDGAANFREETLNGIAFCIGNALIDAMSASIVQWINSGFKNPDGTSGPSFLSDPGTFFKQMADREVGGFFQELGIIGNILCKPFDLKVRLGLLDQYNNYNNMRANQCSLESIKQNLDNFGRDDYLSDWFQLTQQDNNNAIGSHFIARQKLSNAIIYNRNTNTMEVNLGGGFLNLKKCVAYSTTKFENPQEEDSSKKKPMCEKWETTTPGKEVQATLDRAIGSKTHRLEIATNFNQIIAALVSQIITQVVGGLSGGNDDDSDSNSGYRRYTNQNNVNSLTNNTSNLSNGDSGTSTATSTATTTSYYTLSVYHATSSEYTTSPSQPIRGLANPYRNNETAVIRAPLVLNMELRSWSGCTAVVNEACYVFMDGDKTVFVDMKSSD